MKPGHEMLESRMRILRSAHKMIANIHILLLRENVACKYNNTSLRTCYWLMTAVM